MDLSSLVTPVSNAVEFRLVKTDTTDEGDLTTEARSKIDELIQLFKASENLKSLYYGQQLEDPGVMVFCAESVADVPQLEMPCEMPGPWPTSGWLVTMKHNPREALGAPVIEICTAFDCNPSYIDALKTFVDHIDKDQLDGYHGAAYGETMNPLTNSDSTAPGKAANLIIGWDSKQAHIDAKAKPGNAILANINLLREGRGALSMFHVAFKQA